MADRPPLKAEHVLRLINALSEEERSRLLNAFVIVACLYPTGEEPIPRFIREFQLKLRTCPSTIVGAELAGDELLIELAMLTGRRGADPDVQQETEEAAERKKAGATWREIAEHQEIEPGTARMREYRRKKKTQEGEQPQ